MSTLSSADTPTSSDEYQIGWICALPIELAAGLVMFDQEFGGIEDKDAQDTNSYHAGRIQGHNVVIACLPDGEYGTNAAAVVATNMLRTFKNLKFGLLVGIGGGLPHSQRGQPGHDLCLGDVVVSSARGTTGGVIQYDLGKQVQSRELETGLTSCSTFRRCGQLDRPPLALRTALASLKAKHLIGRASVYKILQEKLSDPDLEETFHFPGRANDHLFHSSHVHFISPNNLGDCSECDLTQTVLRPVRSKPGPKIFYGTVLSANRVIKDSAVRDQLRDQFASESALCVEMEAAGLMNSFPCLVIRGICDYSDSHKSDAWHNYSALTAAALTKDLLSYISIEETNKEKAISLDDYLGFVKDQFQPIHNYIDYRLNEDKRDKNSKEEEKTEDILKNCHRDLCPDISYLEAKRNISDRAKDTCGWVLKDPMFLAWQSAAHNDLLWISADPGCGKSVFSKALIDEVLPASELQSLCYFFFNDTTGQKSLSAALCAVLHQLFTQQKHLRRHAKEFYEEFGPRIKDEVEVLWKILLAAASDIDDRTLPITCVIDALDEAAEHSRKLLIKYLCAFYTGSCGKINGASPNTGVRLRFLVTSRPYNTVRERFEILSDSLPKIHLKGEERNNAIRHEINAVVRQKAEEITARCKLSEKTKTLLENKLLGMEHRTYLWLYLAVDDIERQYKYSIDPDSVTFDALPGSVDDAYEQILQRVAKEARDTVRKILLIVVGAARALTISEMCIALGILNATAIDHSHLAENMRSWCGLFVFFNDSKVYLLHQTAKDFLISHGKLYKHQPLLWKGSIEATEPDRAMATICARILCITTNKWIGADDCSDRRQPDTTEIRQSRSNIQLYAGLHWVHHVKSSLAAADDTMWKDIMALYDRLARSDKDRWIASTKWTLHPFTKFEPCVGKPIFLALFAGHFDLLEQRVGVAGFRVDDRDKSGETPLIFAAQNGLAEAVSWLVHHGADVDSCSSDGESALLKAAKLGHAVIVNTLLSNQADVDAKKSRSHPLLRAALYGEANCVISLIGMGSDVNAKGSYYGSALQCAAYFGHHDMVELLLQFGADVNAREGMYGSALQAACVAQNERIVELLLKQRANVNDVGGMFGSALCAAVRGAQFGIQITQSLTMTSQNIFTMLMQAGAHVDATGICDSMLWFICPRKYAFPLRYALDGDRWTPADRFEIGAWYTRLSTTEQRILLKFMRESYKNYEMPTINACYAPEVAMEELMSIFVEDERFSRTVGGRSLVDFLRRGLPEARIFIGAYDEDKDELLLRLQKRNLDIPILSCDTCDILERVCSTNNWDSDESLVVVSCTRSGPGQLIQTPLQFACLEMNERVVDFLLAAGADPNTSDFETETPLQIACRLDHHRIISKLVSKGANLNLRGSFEQPTALERAADSGSVETVQLLLNAQAKVNGKGVGKDCEALHVAASKGNADTVAILLKYGANMFRCSERYGTVLHAAVTSNSGEVAMYLIHQGANVDAISNGLTPLQWACLRQKLDMVRLLINCKANVQVGKKNEDIPLMVAIRAQNVEIAKLLLDGGVLIRDELNTRCGVLIAAIESGNEQLVRPLLGRGVSVNPGPRCINQTPLYVAARNCNIHLVALLLAAGADINASFTFRVQRGEKQFHKPALHRLASRGNIAGAKILIAAGISFEMTSDTESTELSMAQHCHQWEFVDWLRDYLARRASTEPSAALDEIARIREELAALAPRYSDVKELVEHSRWTTGFFPC